MSATAQKFYAREAELRDRDKGRCPVAASAQDLVQEALLHEMPQPTRTQLEYVAIELGAMVERGQELTAVSAAQLRRYIEEHVGHTGH